MCGEGVKEDGGIIQGDKRQRKWMFQAGIKGSEGFLETFSVDN
jgi:hypothetical protein